MTVNPEIIKAVMRNWVSGVAIVTSSYEGINHGMTVNSFTSVSLVPPLIVVTLANNTRTLKLVKQSGKLGITILSENQKDISDRFAGKISEDEDRFNGIDVFDMKSEIRYFAGGLGWLDCIVKNDINLGASTLFIAEVMNVKVSSGDPLLYHNQDYYRLGDKYE